MEITGSNLYIFNTLNASHIEILSRLAAEENSIEIKVGHEVLYLKRFGLIQGNLSGDTLLDAAITDTGRSAIVFIEEKKSKATQSE